MRTTVIDRIDVWRDDRVVLDDPDVRRRREEVIRAHIAAEKAGDVDGLIASFNGRAHYDFAAVGQVLDTNEAVATEFRLMREAFPDITMAIDHEHHGDDAVVLEGRLVATHRGPWMGVPATGRRVEVRVASIFHFDGDRLTNETLYFDTATFAHQLGVELPS